MDYGKILTRAWEIIWKFKVLWIFGILASCGQGSSGGGSGGGNSGVQFKADEVNLHPGIRSFFSQIDRFFDNIDAWQVAVFIGGLILFMLIMGLLMTALSTIGRIGLVQGTVQAEEGVDRLTFSDLFTSGKPFFWRVFALNLIMGFIILIIMLIILAPVIGFTILTAGIGALCLIPLICVLVPLGWMISVVMEQANIALVVEDLGIIEAIQRGWTVFRENLGKMVIMALILGVGSFFIGITLALPIIIIAVPAVLGIVGGAIADSSSIIGGGLVVAMLCFVAYLPVLIVLGGILRSYINTAWTLTYLTLTTESTTDTEEPEIQTDDSETA
ncbi:MAG: hypothetical protein IMY76_00850 [Chloroflexi bacterium]|nr:hypothetical protein [Chloroflexota bacterium]